MTNSCPASNILTSGTIKQMNREASRIDRNADDRLSKKRPVYFHAGMVHLSSSYSRRHHDSLADSPQTELLNRRQGFGSWANRSPFPTGDGECVHAQLMAEF